MTTIRYKCYPQTEPPPDYALKVADVFRGYEAQIGTVHLAKGLTSDGVLKLVRPQLEELGFDVEKGKRKGQKIERPVFFGENGEPTLTYEVDAYHSGWRCSLEVEAGRGWTSNAIYRDLVQAMVMVQVDCLILAVANNYKYKSGDRLTISTDYDNTIKVAEALYGHSRLKVPYRLMVLGY